ncbi:MAG: hypothetical protein MJ152_00545, partial [Clostridia bacterium]|nr:hypothetical protein [Clostridia bacterium]
MKKRLFTLLAMFMLSLTCISFTGCGNKYDNLEFEIKYAFDQNATTWYGVDNNSMVLHYGADDDELTLDDGVGYVYFHVGIKNVNEKDLDEVIVTSTGRESITIKPNTTFGYKIEDVVNTPTPITFYETNSNKKNQINLEVYESLKDITIKEVKEPYYSVNMGKSIDLTKLNNLQYTPGVDRINQTAVKYTVESIGHYSFNGEYVPHQTTELGTIVEIDNNGILRFKDGSLDIDENKNIARIKASSVDRPEIFAEFDVYLSEIVTDGASGIYKPKVYKNELKLDELESVDVYATNKAEYSQYAKTTVYLDYEKLDSKVYSQTRGVRPSNPDKVLTYSVDAEIDPESGFTVSKVDEHNFTITAVSEETTKSVSKVKFVISVKGLQSEEDVCYEQELTLHARQIVSAISIDGEPYTDKQVVQKVIYYTDKDTDLWLDLNVSPNDNFEPKKVIAYVADENERHDLNIYDENNHLLPQHGTIEANSKIRVNFQDNATDGRLILSVDVEPTGKKITVEVNIKKVVTANKLLAYEAYDNEHSLLDPNNRGALLSYDPSNPAYSPLYLDVNDISYAYVKACYKGTQLDASSVVATISDCPSGVITFNNTKKSTTINLTDDCVYKIGTATEEGGDTYDIFRIAFATTGVGTANVKVQAGNGNVGILSSFYVSSVEVASSEDISVTFDNSTDATKCKDTDNSLLNLALVAGGNTRLSFQGKVKNNWSDNVIQRFTILSCAREGYSTTAVKTSERTNHQVSVYANRVNQESQTEILEITFEVYEKDGYGAICATSFKKYMQVAVYYPISEIEVTGSTEIAYTNKKYNSLSTTILNFSAKNSYNKDASSNIKFANLSDKYEVVSEEIVSSVSQLKIKFAYDISTSEEVEVNIVDTEKETVVKRLLTDTILIDDLTGEDLLQGKLQVKLNSKPQELRNLRMTLVAMSLGKETVASKMLTVKFDNFEAVSNVLINSTEDTTIVRESMNSNYVYMSFMGTDKDTIEAHLYAEAKYSTSASTLRWDKLGYTVKRVVQNDDGSIFLDEDGNVVLQDLEINQRYFNVTFDYKQHLATISIKREEIDGENISGGIYMLTIGAQDSYNDSKQQFNVGSSLFVSVSDGSVKNKYMLTNENFMDIGKSKNNLNANYVLYEDIKLVGNFKPIGLIDGAVEKFNGKLYGTLESVSGNAETGVATTSSRHSITYCVSQSVGKETLYAGLFASLGEKAELNGVDFYPTIKEDTTFDSHYFDVSDGNTLNLGAVVGSNEGKITNVVVYLNLEDENELTISNASIKDGVFNFGAVAGVNKGTIDLTKSTIIVEGKLNIGSSNNNAKLNLGAVVGTNDREIVGDYTGTLDEINYNVINNLLVIDNSATTRGNYYVGGIAGTNYGEIKQLIVGGHLEFRGDSYGRGFVSGVAGLSNNASVDTVVVLALDIICSYSTSNSTVEVAGVSASSTDSTYKNIKFVSAQVEYSNDLLQLPYSVGKIYSVGNVAGIVAVGSAKDVIENCSVENFIAKVTNGSAESDFYTLEGSAVYGIAGGSVQNVSYCFVTANINAENVWAIAPNYNNCYFIGKTTASGVNVNSDSTNYIVVIETNVVDNIVMYTYNEQEQVFFTKDDITTNWETSFGNKTNFAGEGRDNYGWLKFADGDFETLNSKIVDGITICFPYITVDGKASMIISPTEIVASINSAYIAEINSIYVVKIDETKITETAIINYHYFESEPTKSAKFNTYKISDLVDLQVVPEDATGGVQFVVVEGFDFAYLNNKNEITFTGVTGNKNRIVIKCYSIFNPDEYEYIVFYTQFGISSLIFTEPSEVISSDSSDYDYEIAIINGGDDTDIRVSAENIFKDESFKTLFNSGAESNLEENIDKYLKIEVTNEMGLPINPEDETYPLLLKDLGENYKFRLGIRDNVTDSCYRYLTFTLHFNLTKYFGESVYPQIDGKDQFMDLNSVVLKVDLIMSAKDIIVNNGDITADTQSTIQLDVDLRTGYIKNVNATNIVVGQIVETYENNVVKFEQFEEVDNGGINNRVQAHDYINLTMEAESGAEELANLMKNAGVSNIVDLFDYDVKSETILQATDVVGFKYTGAITFKNEHNFRYIKSEIVLKATVYATTNNDVKATFKITIQPTDLSTVRLTNYSTTAEYQNQSLTWLIKQTETNIISPSQNGLIVVNLEPSYANIDLIDSNTKDKKSLRHPSMMPEVSLVDPLLTLNLPRHVIASSG